METGIHNRDKIATAIDCVTGKTKKIVFRDGAVTGITETESREQDLPFIGNGLIDLQINGINGIDFNNPALTEQDVVNATQYLLSQGVTTYLPTVITNSDENIRKLLAVINRACLADPVVNECVWGIHLEGPFLSPAQGAKGAHDEKYIKAPDWDLFSTYQEAAGGKIKLVTIAPEWEGSCEFIARCREQNIIVSIGHSMANSEQIKNAVKAGASMSTHLGNGVPLSLPRHPNVIWDQLAAEQLSTCIITDGIHIPDSLIKVVMKTKGQNTLVVSDATCFAGMPPGEYENHIGGKVILDKDKRVSVKDSGGILAGAAKSLLENVETLINHDLSTLGEAWQMASGNVAKVLAKNDPAFNDKNDFVIFRLDGEIQVEWVIKNGKIVFEQ